MLDDYRLLKESVGMVRRPTRNVFKVRGGDRTRFLHNLTTNDVKSLAIGEGCYATMVTRTGKLVGDLRIKRFDEHFLVDTDNPLVFDTMQKFIVMDDVTMERADLSVVDLVGPKRISVQAKSFGYKVLGNLILSPEPFQTTQVMLLDESALGVPAVSPEAAEIVRVENGRPKWGTELTDKVIPVEAGLETYAISYTKGCYVGQEVIQRIKTYSEAKQHLVGLKLDSAVNPDEKVQIEDREAGWVTSFALSPRFGPIALAYVRKEFKEAKRARVGQATATLHALPFG